MASATALSLTSPISAASSALLKNSGASKRRTQVYGLSLYTPCKPELVPNRSRVVKLMAKANVNDNVFPKKLEEQKSLAVSSSTALAIAAAMVIPEMAEAVAPGVSPSLKNFLLSIVSGGVVLAFIAVAVIGVSNFDPVKRT